MTKKAGIITFHGSHNYGSVLQAFALFKTIESFGLKTEIINFRSTKQKKFYSPAHTVGKNSFEKTARRIFLGPFKNQINKKYLLFEEFIKQNFSLSEIEYSSAKQLEENPPAYDFYICGSDQIWNTNCVDFDWVYYLSFVKKGKKIAYAPSMGQRPSKIISPENSRLIKKYLAGFDAVSAREQETADYVQTLTGGDIPVLLDPTFLVPRSEWKKIISPKPIINGKYIFYYSPRYQSEDLKIARKLSKQLKLPVVTSIVHSSKFVVLYPDFKKAVASGPAEFLNLCKNATLLCGDSYHLLVFALIFNTPIFCTKGITKTRLKHLLDTVGLTERSITLNDFDKKITSAFDIDFSDVNQRLKTHQIASLEFLKNTLELN